MERVSWRVGWILLVKDVCQQGIAWSDAHSHKSTRPRAQCYTTLVTESVARVWPVEALANVCLQSLCAT